MKLTQIRFGVAACATFLAGVLFAAPVVSITPVPQSDRPDHWWQKRFAEKQELVKKGGSAVVFIGDSIVHGLEGSAVWREKFAAAPFHALNLGFSGDRTEHVLWRLDHGELDGYKAKVVVLMIGTNNIGHRSRADESPIDTIIGINEIIRKIRWKQPQAKIILHPIFPRGERPDDERRQRVDAVNEAVRQLADGQSVFLCDFNDVLLNADGTLSKDIMPDFLHPSDRGRKIWARALLPMLNRLLASKDADYPPAARATPRRLPEYVGRMTDRRRQTMSRKGETLDVVFLGDSITHGWEGNGREVFKKLCADYKILNLGHSGDRTEHLVWRFLNGEMEGYKTKLFMLMIGTNNGNDSAEDVAAGIKRIIEITQKTHPEAKMLLLPIFPRNSDAKNNHRIKNEKTNAIIKGYADGNKVIWCDFNDKFLEPGPDKVLPRSIMPDLLHPNHDGYLIWEAAVRPFFEKYCRGK